MRLPVRNGAFYRTHVIEKFCPLGARPTKTIECMAMQSRSRFRGNYSFDCIIMRDFRFVGRAPM